VNAAWMRHLRSNRFAVVGAIVLAAIVLMAATAGLLYPGDPLYIVGPPEQWPFHDARFPLGTDAVGRDIAAIILHGSRTALAVGCAAAAVTIVTGLTIGALGGYFGGWVDEALTRITELFQTIPHIIFILAVVTVLGPRITVIVLAIGATNWTSVARVARAEFLSWRERDFVLADHAIGMGNLRIIVREILPNALPPIIVLVSFTVASSILLEAALAFLGYSDPNIASWGRLIGEGRQSLRSSWYISAIPGVAIMLAVLAMNFIGDALTDALDLRARRA
jgi:peptide/nickel transport system permease protein